MKTTALIMAGGRGERFWPKSRKACPKQFLSITSEKTMIQETVSRILPIVNIEDIFISTNEEYRELVYKQLPDLPRENVLCEPVGKNTGPCIGLGAIHMRKKYGDSVMIVLPSDHSIKQTKIFQGALKSAVDVADESGMLVTLGISPSSPDTGYGYIQYDDEVQAGKSGVYKVQRFVEKPDLETAKKYVESGDYLWNSGMFVWKVSTILDQIKDKMPDNYELLEKIEASVGTSDYDSVLKNEFMNMRSISIDYGIMEKTKDIFILPVSFGWDDVGSWLAVSRLREVDENKNVLLGNVINVNSKNCIVQGGKKLIAMVGMDDAIVVDTEDALLVCDKKSAGNIRDVIAQLKNDGKDDLL